MSDPTFGVSFRRVDEEARPVLGADLSTIGIVGPAPGADDNFFPFNIPVLVHSNNTSLIKRLGVSGYIRDALEGINEQLGEMESAARTIVVRTRLPDQSITDHHQRLLLTMAEIAGSSVDFTGVHALKRAPQLLGFFPRLIIVPGYTGQTAMNDEIGRVLQTDRGSGYIPGNTYNLVVTGGGENPGDEPTTPAQMHAWAMDDGSLADAVVDNPGAGYFSPPKVEGPTPDGPALVPGLPRKATYKAYVKVMANPVIATLPDVLEYLRAHAVVESSGVSEMDDFNWRSTMQHQRLIPISGGCKVLDVRLGAIFTRPLAPRVVGIAVRRDHQKGAPFHSWANQPVQGILGPARDISFSIADGENEGQELLRQANMGILVRGEIGNDYAIASGGFVFIGTDNAGEDELWRFYNVTRGRDYIEIGMMRALRYFLGRFNITGHTIQAILNTIKFFLRDLYADNHILGYKIDFRGAANSVEKIRQGKLTVGFAAEEPPVLRHIITESARYRYAIELMVSQLERQLNLFGLTGRENP